MIIKSQTQFCFPVTQLQKKINIFNKQVPYLHLLHRKAWHSSGCCEEDPREGLPLPSCVQGAPPGQLWGHSGQGAGIQIRWVVTKISFSPQVFTWGAGRNPLLHKYLGDGCLGATAAKTAASAPPTALSVLAYAKHLLISACDLLEYKQRDLTLLMCNFM